MNDLDLLAENFGVRVAFRWTGCPGLYGRKDVNGVIVDVRSTKRNRYVLVAETGLKVEPWVNLNDVQFVGQTKTLPSMKEVSVSVQQ